MFAPHQIVRLECDSAQLYAEVIQVLEARQLCWVRPLMLIYDGAELSSGAARLECQPEVQPVVDGPDLLWPLGQFHPALDTEVLPLLALLEHSKSSPTESHHVTTGLLRQFIEQLWVQQAEAQGDKPERG